MSALDVTPFERHEVLLTRGATRRGGSSGGGFREPVLAQVGRVRVPGGVAADHTDAGATLPARDQLLDLGVVEARRRHPTVLGEHLGEVAAVPQRSVQRALEHRSFDHVVTSVRRCPLNRVAKPPFVRGGCLS